MKVGDEVLLTSRWFERVEKIERETNTMFVLSSGYRFKKGEKRLYGTNGFDSTSVRLCTEEDKLRIINENVRNKLIVKVKDSIQNLDLDKLKRIYEIINE